MRRANKLLITMLSLAVLFAVFAFSSSAAEHSVSSATELTTAISSATAGDTIIVSGTIEVSKQVRIAKNLTIKGNGDAVADVIKLSSSGDAAQALLIVGAEVTLENITIDGNNKGRCVYVYNDASTLIMNEGAILQNGKTTGSNRGAGILVRGGKVIMNGGSITNNTAGGHGGGVGFDNAATTATFTMNGGYITNNTSGANGGAIFSVGSLYIKGGEISGNKAPNAEAGVHASQGSLDLYHGVVFGTNTNTSTSAAGNNISIGETAVLNFCFEWNAAKQAQTGLSGFSTMTIDGMDVTAPTTKGTKAGRTYIIIDGEVAVPAAVVIPQNAKVTLKGKTGTSGKLITNSTTSNRAVTVSNGAELTLENITIDASASTNAKGARSVVVVSGGTLNITGGTVLTGGHGLSGAGIYNQGTVVMTGGSITGNAAVGGAGGVNTNGKDSSFTITGGYITNNTSDKEGGGIYCHTSGALVIGGTANVTGNTTLGKASNIYVVSTSAANTTIQSGFTGTAGFSAAIRSINDSTLSYQTAVLGTGYTFNASQLLADDRNYTISASGTSLMLTTTTRQFTFNSPNGQITTSSAQSELYKLTAPTAPKGYEAVPFAGYVQVSGYGSDPVPTAVYGENEVITADNLSNLCPIWVKVETETGAAIKLEGNSGIRFISTVDTATLEAVGLKVKSSDASGNGFYRGMVLATSSSFDSAQNFTKETCKMDAKLDFTNWGSHLYKSFTGKTLAAGTESFSVAINYKNPNNYNKAMAFRGYIGIQVGGKEVVVYSHFISPDSLVDSDDATYGVVHARSARAVARNVYFNITNTEAQVRAVLGDKYDLVMSIAGYTEFPKARPTAAQLAYYLKPLAPGGAIKADDQIQHIGIFGNSIVTSHSMPDMIEQMGVQDGVKIVFNSISYNSQGTSGEQNLKSMFKMSGNSFLDANGAVTTDPSKFAINTKVDNVGSKLQMILNDTEKTPMDKFYIVMAREVYYYKSTLPAVENEYLAAQAVAIQLSKKFPDIEFVIVVPPAFDQGDMRYINDNWNTNMSGWLDTGANSMISAIQTVCPNNTVRKFSLDSYYNQFSLSDIDLHIKETSANSKNSTTGEVSKFNGKTIHRNPTMAASYLNAMLLYYDLTGRCCQGIENYGYLPEAECQRLQAEVHRLIGCTATRHSHTPLAVGVLSGTGTYAFKDVTDSSVYPAAAKWNALLSTIMAYDARGSWVQYDQKRLNRNVDTYELRDYRHSGTDKEFSEASPEDATPTNTVFSDCSDWMTQIFYETFGDIAFTKYRGCSAMYRALDAGGSIANITNVYTWTDDNNFNNLFDEKNDNGETTDNDGKYALYLNGTKSSDNYSKANAKAKFVELLQPGDIMLYIHYTTPNSARSNGFSELGGHVMIYIGDGMLAHCSGDQAGGGGSDYSVNGKADLSEYVGGIQLDPVDIFMDDMAIRNMFDEAAVLILRPNYSALTVNSNTTNRVNNMLGIVAYKDSVANQGTSVAPGETISIDYVIKNTTPYLRDLDISEELPTGVAYVSGLSYNTSTRMVTGTVTLNPYETVTVSYKIKVNASATGTITLDTSTVGGVAMGDVVINVGKTLTAAEQTSFAEYIRANNGSYTDMYALASAAYNNMGKNLASKTEWSTLVKALQTMYTSVDVSGTQFYNVKITPQIRAGNLYGGLNLRAGVTGYDPVNRRVKKMYLEHFMVGDIVAYVPQNTARYTDTTVADNTIANSAQCFVYLGNETFAMYKAGVYTEVSGSAAFMLIDSMFGEKLFTVMRPSLVF